MSENKSLVEKKCQPCEGIGNAFTEVEAKEQMGKIPGWNLNDDYKGIHRLYITKNFVKALDFINKVGEIAENDNHHPDIHLTGYRNLRIDLSTHALGGLTENDLILAAKINEVPVELKS